MRFLRFYLSMSSLAAIASVMCLSSSTFCHSPFNKQTKCAWTLNRQQNTAFISIWSNLFYCNKVIALKTLSSFLCLFHYYHRDENARTQCHLAHDSRTRNNIYWSQIWLNRNTFNATQRNLCGEMADGKDGVAFTQTAHLILTHAAVCKNTAIRNPGTEIQCQEPMWDNRIKW